MAFYSSECLCVYTDIDRHRGVGEVGDAEDYEWHELTAAKGMREEDWRGRGGEKVHINIKRND